MLASIRSFFAVTGRLSPALAGRIAAWLFARPRRHARPERERALIARGEPVALPAGLRATSWGVGPTVLLVHGWEGRGAQLGAFVDPLVASGHRVIALDGPAHGDSPGRTTTGVEFAAALATVRQSVGPLAAIVAHSFGGFSSLLAISRGVATDRLAIIAAPSSVPEVLADFVELIHLPRRALPHLVRALEERVHAAMESFEVASFAHTVKIPVLVAHDTEDKEVSYEHGPRLAEMLGAQLLTTTGLGHRRILFAPEVVNTIVEFVDEARTARQNVTSTREEE
ncbi:MAG: alpha/beta fold hydrolase [bacterium]